MRLILRKRTGDAAFVHPIDPSPRTAVLASGLRETKLTRVFPHGWSEQVARFSPASVAGPMEQLLRVADARWNVEHSIVVFTYPGERGLRALDRESLWTAFGVPIFEQYLGPGNELLATECDAHAGLHVVNGYQGLELEHDVCPCGNPAPRIVRGSRIDELVALLS
jgi:hypothetical protein